MRKLLYIFLIDLLCLSYSYSQISDWEQLDGPTGFNIYTIVSLKNDKLIVGGSSGLFTTTNRGICWTRSTLSKYITSLLVTRNNEIIASTIDSGIFKSTDEGLTWINISEKKFLLSFSDSSGKIYAFYEQEFYQSIDQGYNWKRVVLSGKNMSVQSSIINQRGTIYLLTSEGLFSSFNNGDSWTKNSKQKFNDNGILGCSNDTLWYCGNNSFWSSFDSGKSWQKIKNNKPDGWPYKFITVPDGSMYLSTKIHNGDRNVILKSTDRGITWSACFNSKHQIKSILFTSENEIFITSIYLYKTNDGGSSWSNCSDGLTNDGIRILTINAKGIIFAASSWGLYRSIDDGRKWMSIDTSFVFGGTDPYRCILPIDSNIVFLGTSQHGLYKSINKGLSWIPIKIDYGDYVYALGLDKRDRILLYTGTGAFLSADTGRTWQKSYYQTWGTNNFVVNDEGYLLITDIYDSWHGEFDLYVCNSQNDTCRQVVIGDTLQLRLIKSTGNGFFVHNYGNLYYSNDNGNSWNKSECQFSENMINIIETKDGRLIAATENGGIYFSVDHGKSWVKIKNQIKTTFIMSMALHSDGHLYVGTLNGIFRSRITGENLQ